MPLRFVKSPFFHKNPTSCATVWMEVYYFKSVLMARKMSRLCYLQ